MFFFLYWEDKVPITYRNIFLTQRAGEELEEAT